MYITMWSLAQCISGRCGVWLSLFNDNVQSDLANVQYMTVELDSAYYTALWSGLWLRIFYSTKRRRTFLFLKLNILLEVEETLPEIVFKDRQLGDNLKKIIMLNNRNGEYQTMLNGLNHAYTPTNPPISHHCTAHFYCRVYTYCRRRIYTLVPSTPFPWNPVHCTP